jgi:protein ImuB
VRGRVACVDVPALPLQLLVRAHPEWRGAPLAVVEEDHPQARILWLDGAAMKKGVRIGMRYAVALTLCRELRAAEVDAKMIEEVKLELFHHLHDRSPKVEPDAEKQGVFWVDPSGLESLFGPLERWAQDLHRSVMRCRLRGAVVVGFARFPTWAIARARTDVFVIDNPAEEAALAGKTPLALLEIEPELRDALLALGVTTLDGFLRLPRGEVGLRFGPPARELHALYADAMRPPMQALAVEEPVFAVAELETPDDDLGRLLFCIKGGLHALIFELSRRALALRALKIHFELERGDPRIERIEPARATRDALSILELLRLRLSSIDLGSRVARILLEAEPSRLDGTQLALFAGRRHDPESAERGIARLRATFGDDAVTCAALRDAWLPEHAFTWEPASTIGVPERREQPDEVGLFVRRVFAKPEPLAMDRNGRPLTDPPLAALAGPYRVQNGWWAQESLRDYFYAEREDGALLWIFRDKRLDRWFVHGVVD